MRRVNPLLLIGVLLAWPAMASPPVEVLALFKDRALLRASGDEHLLREGQTSPDGITLLEADAEGAKVRYDGEVYALTLSRQVAGNFKAAERQQVSITPDDHGQYRIRGAINGTFVNFLVDTGASIVAMSERHASLIGIDPSVGQLGSVQTAQGTVDSRFLTLDKVVVGGLTAHNVQAAVITGTYPVEILLGMSFLREVSLREEAGVLTLTQKY
ncbi:MAG: TIGR02281 family clan AA aspartic protease [Pseudomonadales bacterium]